MSSEWIPADEALELGIIWKVCAPDELMAETMRRAQVLATKPISSLIASKELVMAPIKAEIVTFRPDQELVWRSTLLAPGLFDRDHIFRIEPTAAGCTLKQIQTFAGPIAPVAGMLTSEMVRHGLKNMNEALKRRVERIHNT